MIPQLQNSKGTKLLVIYQLISSVYKCYRYNKIQYEITTTNIAIFQKGSRYIQMSVINPINPFQVSICRDDALVLEILNVTFITIINKQLRFVPKLKVSIYYFNVTYRYKDTISRVTYSFCQ
ncbi:hypothetical protein QTP88_009207 [Uroleucon formosanum]